MIFSSLVNSMYHLQIAEGSFLATAQDLNIIELINRGIAYAILAAGLLSVVFIFIGGISFILSGGEEDKIKQAVNQIRYSIIGLIIVILAVIIVNAVGQAIGLNPIRYIRFDEIVQIIQSTSDNLQSDGSSSSRSLD
jgi:uncharacterized membrane protein